MIVFFLSFSTFFFFSIISPVAWFNHFAGVTDPHYGNEDMLRKRLQMHNATTGDESERDGSDSSCSESVGGSTGAFRPTPNSPKDANNTTSNSTASYPSPNISVGPPIHPGPHLLPYLYPHGTFLHFFVFYSK